MGILGLTKFLSDKAPGSIQNVAPESFMGRTVAVDASMSLYQFMVAIRDSENYGNLTNSAGETTSHIAGMLSRAIRILELGMKPIYVFDGTPPEDKAGELAKRKQRKETALEQFEDAKELGDGALIKRYAGRVVKVTKQHNEDVKTLLRLMGIPIVDAPGEAEAQCAVLCRKGLAYAVATEDADALCFGAPYVLRRLTFTDPTGKNTVMMLCLSKILSELEFTMDQFIDFCILCGCDYCGTIKGMGPSTAYKYIKEHLTIERAIENIKGSKYQLPDPFNYKRAREIFQTPDVTEDVPASYNCSEPDEEGLRKFLIQDQSFSETRVENALIRLRKARNKGAQTRLENFFKASGEKRSSKVLTNGASNKNNNNLGGSKKRIKR